MKKTLITGITGQDGSYLAEILLEKGNNRDFKNLMMSIHSTPSNVCDV